MELSTYSIQVQQTIIADGATKDEPGGPKFKVASYPFNLPADSIHAIYPGQGQQATHDTLPHIVFNDSTLLWERISSHEAEDLPPDNHVRNRVPWMALLVFSPDELLLNDTEKAGIFAHTSLNNSSPEQLDSMAVRVRLNDLVKLKEGTARVPLGDFEVNHASKSDITNVIFPKTSLFNRLFAAYDDDGKPLSGGPDISRRQFLAHVMRMNSTGATDADSGEIDTRHFGVVVANRVGPLDSSKPSEMIVHLVSLENVESLKPFPLPEMVLGSSPDQPARVGLISLHSWSYTCLPPNSLNVTQAFEHIARTASMLRATIPPQPEHPDELAKLMSKRLEEGYSLTRFTMPTGEISTALFRGPLTPKPVSAREQDVLSNSASDLSIFDEKLGIMDISFSSAWSLGKALALADRSFTTSLMRVRHEILRPVHVTSTAQRQRFKREDLVKSLDNLMNEISTISHSSSKNLASTASFTEASLEEATLAAAKSSSPDWRIVLNFLLDLHHLVNVPSRYLLPEPSMLPRESMRFFFVDRNWIDALVDGALSLGYQGDATKTETDDIVRRAIRKAIQRVIEDPTGGHNAPLPRYGFLFRSDVVKRFPDLKVSVEGPGGGGPSERGDAMHLLRHSIIDEEVILGFFSDAPLSLREGFRGGLQLRFELPAHQQYFSLGSITDQGLEMAYKDQPIVTQCFT